MKTATKLKFLQWFWENADFGPAHDDVMMSYIEDFERDIKLKVPISCREIYFYDL